MPVQPTPPDDLSRRIRQAILRLEAAEHQDEASAVWDLWGEYIRLQARQPRPQIGGIRRSPEDTRVLPVPSDIPGDTITIRRESFIAPEGLAAAIREQGARLGIPAELLDNPEGLNHWAAASPEFADPETSFRAQGLTMRGNPTVRKRNVADPDATSHAIATHRPDLPACCEPTYQGEFSPSCCREPGHDGLHASCQKCVGASTAACVDCERTQRAAPTDHAHCVEHRCVDCPGEPS